MYAARANDPESSFIAAEANEMSGRRRAQKLLTVAAVLAHPGSTSRELHELTGIDRHTLGRRLSEVAKDGKIKRGEQRVCTFAKTPAVTWWGPDHVIQLGLLAA